MIECLTWSQARSLVKRVNPLLCQVIDDINPPNNYFLYKVSYPFGANIVKNGLFHLPYNGKTIPVNQATKIDDLQGEELIYPDCSLPTGIVLKNSFEVYIDTSKNTIPVITAGPGSKLALWRQLDSHYSFHPVNIFSVVAGARNLFMIPNISNTKYHKNLRRDCGVKHQAPQSLLDHQPIFKEIAEKCKSSWTVELLLIPNYWLEKAKYDKRWQKLKLLLLDDAWTTSSYERNQIFFDFALSSIQASNNLKPNPYLLDTLKHLLAITLGALPAFTPLADESQGPIQLIQEVYRDSYGLKGYNPTLFAPSHLDITSHEGPAITYYSLQYPTTLSFSPRSRKPNNTLSDLHELKFLMEHFLKAVRQNQSHLEQTVVSELPFKIEYNYFHNKPDRDNEVELADNMAKKDPRLIQVLAGDNDNKFASNGAFNRGCIQIIKKSYET